MRKPVSFAENKHYDLIYITRLKFENIFPKKRRILYFFHKSIRKYIKSIQKYIEKKHLKYYNDIIPKEIMFIVLYPTRDTVEIPKQ